ncbi:Dim gamma-tubulin 6 [Operophtera brumata]|uniref:Dim gamma-tubulin 6 n=1 Tax=Operophtera brumata TaxID=104452 RepID=A0A0L7L9X6_OPEBR|nr:Dim gamma-tubulin 6 [Operophtera brumata]
MATLPMQRDLVLSLKKETYSNVRLLSKVQAMPPELFRQVFNINGLEKPTQTLFNHLSYYLVSIIDHAASTSLPWPLYDTKAERAYRNQLSSFITDCSNKGLLNPVMSSYLVNPGCYKVTMLIFQMSRLAIQKVVSTKMKKDSQIKLYTDMTKKFNSPDIDTDTFTEQIDNATKLLLSKLPNYLQKRKATEKMAEILRTKISQMESKSLKAQKYLDDLVDKFVTKYKQHLDETKAAEILKIKNVQAPSQFFENWLLETDRRIDEMESKWSEKMSPLVLISKTTKTQTESIISRCTGEADKSTYMIEYNHKTDYICTKDLQNQVNSQQKYILRNIIIDEKLNFPNLIRGFLIAIGYVLKNTEIGNEIYQLNECLDGVKMDYSETVQAMQTVMERLMKVEAKLQPSSPMPSHYSSSERALMAEIPPLPDLSNLLSTKAQQSQALFDSFTPLNMYKHKFNLTRRTNFTFVKPPPKSLLITPFCRRPKQDDFIKSVLSSGATSSSYNRANLNLNETVSVLQTHQTHRANETIAECSSGLTKEQLSRLLSTNKSSLRKLKYKTERPDIKIAKGGLFNESTNTFNESNSLLRSHSSPNLFENMENRPVSRVGRRKLEAIKQEDSLSPFDVSGIARLDKESYNTPVADHLKPADSTIMPPASPAPDMKFNADINYTAKETQEKTETPKSNANFIKRTSSLEKIINRFKKVRANALSDNTDEFRSIAEEKETMLTANRVLLPDLLSPSCSVPCKTETETDANETVQGRPRESLGAALGVDETFLDQFNLVD